MSPIRRFPWRMLLLALVGLPPAVALAWWRSEFRPRAEWTEQARIAHVAADGRWLVTDGPAGAKLRDPADGSVLAVLDPPSPDNIQDPHLHHISSSRDGRWLAAEVGGRIYQPGLPTRLKVWEITREGPRPHIDLPMLGGLESQPRHAISADFSTLAIVAALPPTPEAIWSGSEGRNGFALFDLPETHRIGQVYGFPPFALASDGSLMAHLGPDAVAPHIQLLDVRTNKIQATAKASRAAKPSGFVFWSDGKYLVSREHEGPVLLDPKSLAPLADRAPLGELGPFDTRGLTQTFGTTTRYFWRYRNRWAGPPYSYAEAPSRSFAIAGFMGNLRADGRQAVSWSGAIKRMMRSWADDETPRDNSVVTVADFPSMRETARMTDTGVEAAHLSPDGRFVALVIDRTELVGGAAPGPPFSWFLKPQIPQSVRRREVRIRPLPPGPPAAVLDLPPTLPNEPTVDFLADGRTMAIEYEDNTRLSDRTSPSGAPREWTISLWDVPPRLHVPWGPALAVWFGVSAAAWSFSRLLAPSEPDPARLL
jgi:hypothetical protein